MDKTATQNLVIENINMRVPEMLQITDAAGRQVRFQDPAAIPAAGFSPPFTAHVWSIPEQDWHHFHYPSLEDVFSEEVATILGQNQAFVRIK